MWQIRIMDQRRIMLPVNFATGRRWIRRLAGMAQRR
jgi:hypothetical protein